MTRVTPELGAALRAIAEADAGRSVRFTPFFVAQAHGPIRVDPNFAKPQLLQRGVMFALEELGFVQIGAPTSPDNEFGPFQITAAGREAAARDSASALGEVVAPVDVAWERLHPVLEAAVAVWEREGARGPASAQSIIHALCGEVEPSFVRTALAVLADNDWLGATWEMGTDGPSQVTPRQKALQAVRAWPSAVTDGAAVTALLAALDSAIASTTEPEERGRLQRLREAAGDVSKSVLAGAIVAAGKAAAGG